MIVRILEDGQYKVDKPTAKKLDALDAKLGKALDKSDEAAFAKALAGLVKTVHNSGKKLDPSVITPSDLAHPCRGLDARRGAGAAVVRDDQGQEEEGLNAGTWQPATATRPTGASPPTCC